MLSATPPSSERPCPFPCDLPDDDWRQLPYRIHTFTRSVNQALHFGIALSAEWRVVDVPAHEPTRDRPLVRLAFFRTVSDRRGEVEVTVALLPREMAPADCLDLRLDALGESVLRRRDVETGGGLVSDVLTRRVCNGDAVISRWLAIKDGKHAFVVQARALEENYPHFAESFFVALAGFRLTHQGTWPLAESLKTFTRRDPGDFLMLYPESWELVEGTHNSPKALTLNLLNWTGNTLAGLITFVTLARNLEAEPQAVADHYVHELQRSGVNIASLPLSPGTPIAAFDETWQVSYELTDRPEGEVPEVRIVIGRRPDAWFLVALFGPAKRTAAPVWAVNRRAFDIVLKYLGTPDLRAQAAL